METPAETGSNNLFIRIAQGAKKIGQDFLYGPAQQKPSEPTAPHDFITKVKNTGFVDPSDIKRVIDIGLGDVGFYFTLKGLDTKPNEQKSFLETYTKSVVQTNGNPTAADQISINAIKQLDPATQLDPAKFVVIHAQGYNLWRERFRAIAKSVEPTKTPVYVAYAGIIGLREGIVNCNSSEIIIVIPSWIEEKENKNCGYIIDLKNTAQPTVEFLPKNFQRPDAIFIDDALETGMHMKNVAEFWYQNSDAYIPADQTRFVLFPKQKT